MKLQVERDQLAEAVAWTARALPARPTAPVLAGMRLHAGAELTLSTFDYEVSAQATVPVITDEEGTILVSGRLLAEIVRSLPARPVELVTDGTRATLKCGSATFTLVLLPEEEYPTLPEMPPLAGTVGSDALATAIGQVATAAGRDDTLPALTGIRIEIQGDTLTLVATDRYRLAVRELRWNPAQPDLSTAVLVPARVLGETARALTSGAEVSISLGGDSLIGFAGAGRQTTTRLLSGEYPKYAALLPSEFSATAELVASSFAEAVKRVALVAERNTPVRLAFSQGQLVLEAGASEEAQAVEMLEAAFDGEDLQIAFNPQYLLDGIGAIDSDTARISFTSPTKPAVITGKTEREPDYRYVLMPIRSRWITRRLSTVHLTRLGLTDFRSYAELSLELGPGVTTFSGPNGEGKTNLVEAIGYLATLGSHRVATDAPLIRQGAERAVVRAAVAGINGSALVEVELNPGRANRVRLNRAPLPRPRDILGTLRTVLFAPEDLALVKGDPGERRRFLDELLVATAPRYAGVRADYDRVLRQRTALLKSAGGKAHLRGPARESMTATLDAWDAQLARTGAPLLAGRMRLVAALRPHVEAAYEAVSGGRPGEAAGMSYRSSALNNDEGFEDDGRARDGHTQGPGRGAGQRAGPRRLPGRPAPRRARAGRRRAARPRLRQPRRVLVARAGAAPGQLHAAAARTTRIRC